MLFLQLYFLPTYFVISIFYQLVIFNYPVHRQTFELFCIYTERFANLIPIAFLTGFYLTQVVSRWWDQFMTLPWPDKIAFKLVSFIPGKVGCKKTLVALICYCPWRIGHVTVRMGGWG
jgi:hypothetical protein